MVGQRIFDEEKTIRGMGMVVNDELDVKAAVMKRVREIHGGQNTVDGEMTSITNERKPFSELGDPVMQRQEKVLPRSSRYRKRLLSGVAAAVLLGIIGFGVLQQSGHGGLMEHGSRSTINITKPLDGNITLVNSGGRAVMQTVHNTIPVPTTSPAIEKYQSLLATYKEQVLAHLNTGEMAAYYVNDTEFTKLAQDLGYENQVQFAFISPVYSNYQEFVKELKSAGDFWADLPSTLADSYEFEHGIFNVSSPYRSIDAEYKEILEQLKQKAKVDKTGQKLFMKKIAANSINRAEVTYHKGNQSITLSLMQSYTSQVFISEGETAEKWSMIDTGKEAVFITASTKERALWASENRLYWYDEASQMFCNLYDTSNNKLTREQWQMIATSFIR